MNPLWYIAAAGAAWYISRPSGPTGPRPAPAPDPASPPKAVTRVRSAPPPDHRVATSYQESSTVRGANTPGARGSAVSTAEGYAAAEDRYVQAVTATDALAYDIVGSGAPGAQEIVSYAQNIQAGDFIQAGASWLSALDKNPELAAANDASRDLNPKILGSTAYQELNAPAPSTTSVAAEDPIYETRVTSRWE